MYLWSTRVTKRHNVSLRTVRRKGPRDDSPALVNSGGHAVADMVVLHLDEATGRFDVGAAFDAYRAVVLLLARAETPEELAVARAEALELLAVKTSPPA